eukprot:gene11211-12502_t
MISSYQPPAPAPPAPPPPPASSPSALPTNTSLPSYQRDSQVNGYGGGGGGGCLGRCSATSSLLAYPLDFSCYALYALLTCKDLNLAHYRALLFLTFILNLICFLAEVSHMVFLFLQDTAYAMAIIGLLTSILTLYNCYLILKLIYRPSTQLSLLSTLIILILEVFYIVQTVLFAYPNNSDTSALLRETISVVITAVLLTLQLLTAWLLYRYWEYAMFQYDESTNNLKNFINNFPDASLQSPLSDCFSSPLHTPLIDDNASRHFFSSSCGPNGLEEGYNNNNNNNDGLSGKRGELLVPPPLPKEEGVGGGGDAV